MWKTVLDSRTPLRLSEVHLRIPQDEQEMVWDCTLTPIPISVQREPVRFMLVSAVDITEHARANEEMVRLNQLRDDFLARASHELRTPLTSILGNAELLQRNLLRQTEASNGREQKQYFTREATALERMIHQLHRLNRLINEMLDITSIRGEVMQLDKQANVNLVELARRVVEQYKNVSKRTIVLETNQDAIKGTWDETRLEQVLDNLVSNAIKYSPAGTAVKVGIDAQNAGVTVEVRDRGKGISAEDQLHIFDRFYRASNSDASRIEGLGLGLYIANQIILQHGGRMWLESKPEEGSAFYFSLPLDQ